MATLEHVFPLDRDGVRAYETTPERSVVALAARAGVAPLDARCSTSSSRTRAATSSSCRSSTPTSRPPARCSQHPLTTIGLGDSGAHTSQTSDASYSTFALAYWVRERRLMPLERMVRKLTVELADDVGHRRPRRAAPRRVRRPERHRPRPPRPRASPRCATTCPTGAAAPASRARAATSRPSSTAQVLMRDGEHTGALPGVVLRNVGHEREPVRRQCASDAESLTRPVHRLHWRTGSPVTLFLRQSDEPLQPMRRLLPDHRARSVAGRGAGDRQPDERARDSVGSHLRGGTLAAADACRSPGGAIRSTSSRLPDTKHFYACDQLGADGRCLAHATRPLVCRGYPWYDQPVRDMPLPDPLCGYAYEQVRDFVIRREDL